MDWKVFTSVFLTILLAELGDKTQLAAIILAGQTNRPLTVFLGTILALTVITLVGVMLGAQVTKILPLDIVRTIAALVFITLGVLILVGKF